MRGRWIKKLDKKILKIWIKNAHKMLKKLNKKISSQDPAHAIITNCEFHSCNRGGAYKTQVFSDLFSRLLLVEQQLILFLEKLLGLIKMQK